nr:type VII secretion-associated serine protease mycosin [Mycolicibacterium helvum]
MVAAGSAVLLAMSPSASALDPPAVDGATSPPQDTTGPGTAMSQRSECMMTGVVPETDPAAASVNQEMLNLSGAWLFSRGEGQTVAVIDTGVTAGPRLPNVEPGGDYVADTDGLVDCDGHGSAVAGIIAGQSGPDAFSGVAPASRLLSIRLTSAAYAPRQQAEDPPTARSALEIASLARAIVHAADLGARVITVSVATCLRADSELDQQTLGAALHYAAVDKDAVIVAAAGDLNSTVTAGGSECQANPVNPPSDPNDPRNWSGTTSISVPSWWQPYVLSVGSVTATGEPSAFTMAGPWLGIAAPGEGVVSIGNGPAAGLANGFPAARGQWVAFSGTGYASAYVAGVAALVRSRFPNMPAEEVIRRLRATAHNGARSPSNLIGSGVVDPVAALTWQLPVAESGQSASAPTRIEAPLTPEAPDHTPRTVAFAGTVALALAVAGVAVAARRRKDRQE